ncbi:MAG: hypothetical protein PWP56_2605 [Acetobacterium sp.]|nr:hypothetical protein [Acetobacterium sp.]
MVTFYFTDLQYTIENSNFEAAIRIITLEVKVWIFLH